MVEEAKIVGVNLPLSLKKSVEVCDFIRYRNLKKAKELLNLVVEKKISVPYKRYKRNIPHRKGIGVGRFPIKTARYFLMLLNSLEANADDLGLNVDSLVISYAAANKGEKEWHYGRHRRRVMKKAHLELRAVEKEVKQEEKEEKKEKVKEERKEEKEKEIKNLV